MIHNLNAISLVGNISKEAYIAMLCNKINEIIDEVNRISKIIGKDE